MICTAPNLCNVLILDTLVKGREGHTTPQLTIPGTQQRLHTQDNCWTHEL